MRPMTIENIVARYESGLGQGVGCDYKAWLTQHDVPSKGFCRSFTGRKVSRNHIALSTLEYHCILAAQRLPSVIDLREQFPLLPVDETMEIASELQVKHPANGPGNTMPVVMTTDLLLSELSDNGQNEIAVCVKPSTELSKERVLEKLEIERVYWARREVEWVIVTELEVSNAFGANLEWIDGCYDLPDFINEQHVSLIQNELLKQLQTDTDTPLSNVCLKKDEVLGMKFGTCLSIVRHSLARKHWLAPLGEPIRLNRPLAGVKLAEPHVERERAA